MSRSDTVRRHRHSLTDVDDGAGECCGRNGRKKERKTSKPKWMTPMNVQSVFRIKIVSSMFSSSLSNRCLLLPFSVASTSPPSQPSPFPGWTAKRRILLLNRFIAIPALFMSMFIVHFLRHRSYEVNITPFYCLHNVHFEALRLGFQGGGESGRQHFGSESQAQFHFLRNYRAFSLCAQP